MEKAHYNIVLSRMGFKTFRDMAIRLDRTQEDFDTSVPLIYLFNERALGGSGEAVNQEKTFQGFSEVQKHLRENTYIFASASEVTEKVPFTFGYIISHDSIERQRKRNFNELDCGWNVPTEITSALEKEAEEMDTRIEYLSRQIGNRKIELRVCGDITRPFCYAPGSEPYMTLVPARNLFVDGDVPVGEIEAKSKVVIINEDTLYGEQAEIVCNGIGRKLDLDRYKSDLDIGRIALRKLSDGEKAQQLLLDERIRLHVMD